MANNYSRPLLCSVKPKLRPRADSLCTGSTLLIGAAGEPGDKHNLTVRLSGAKTVRSFVFVHSRSGPNEFCTEARYLTLPHTMNYAEVRQYLNWGQSFFILRHERFFLVIGSLIGISKKLGCSRLAFNISSRVPNMNGATNQAKEIAVTELYEHCFLTSTHLAHPRVAQAQLNGDL